MNLSPLSALMTPLIAIKKRHDGRDKVERVKRQEGRAVLQGFEGVTRAYTWMELSLNYTCIRLAFVF